MRAWSFRQLLIFWWILFVIMQQAERLFLLPAAMGLERVGTAVLLKTLITGLRADFIVSTIAVVMAGLLAGLGTLILSWGGWWPRLSRPSHRLFTVISGLFGLVILIVLIIDMGYYYYNHQRLDFVFFEYLDDLMALHSESGMRGAQAGQQTVAELKETVSWAVRLLTFLSVEGLAIGAWWFGFKNVVRQPRFYRYAPRRPYAATLAVAICLAVAGMGFHPHGPYAIRIVAIRSAVYYTLAQNPILYAVEALRASRVNAATAVLPSVRKVMSVENALRAAKEVVGKDAIFPDPRYPLVREMAPVSGVRFQQPANVLLIFVEGLDRRYLGRTMTPKKSDRPLRLTPFLDRLKDDSVYFANFFANGVQTSRGLLSSFCSYSSSQGQAPMKTRYAHDYLCFPSLLQRAGYRTEMVISQHHDINRMHLFMARNGLEELFDENDFPQDAEKSEGRITDAALFARIRVELESLQDSHRPYFLTTLTFSTHHPFTVPMTHDDVRALRNEEDAYIPALRYFDIEFERFFVALQRDGLLKNTAVFILGDHGRHEMKGQNQAELQLGHFMAPLFVWFDPSLRTPSTYRPRVVSIVASQVDIGPTILGLNGLTPRVSPFIGHDLSCVLIKECAEDNVAYLSTVYSDVIALADRSGLLAYSLPSGELYDIDLALQGAAVQRQPDDPAVTERYRHLLGMYVTVNALLERNQIWSWKDWGKRL
jgi:phosphoglycerol transferase MdoB-like AlkP superfamily enzyme